MSKIVSGMRASVRVSGGRSLAGCEAHLAERDPDADERLDGADDQQGERPARPPEIIARARDDAAGDDEYQPEAEDVMRVGDSAATHDVGGVHVAEQSHREQQPAAPALPPARRWRGASRG